MFMIFSRAIGGFSKGFVGQVSSSLNLEFRNDEKMAAHGCWAALPSIIIVEILSYLSLTDRLAASGICRRWRECLYHPLLWKSMSFRVKYGSRRKAKHLAEMCGKFVREALLEFNSTCSPDVRDCLRILDILSANANLERFVFRPQSCHIEWPEPDPEQASFM